MKFLFTKASHLLAFLGLLLATASASPTPAVQREEVTDDTTAKKLTYPLAQITENLISYTLWRISELRKELCHNDENCLKNDEAVAENNLNLPTMTEEDGCFQIGSNWSSCLLKTTSGLLEFQVYLQYIQKQLSDNQKDTASGIQSNTRSLIEILKLQIKKPHEIVFPSPSANASLMEELQSQKGWQNIMAVQLILRRLQDFLQYALRALRDR